MGSQAASPQTSSTTTQTMSPQAQQVANQAFPMLQQYANSQIQLPGQTIAGFNPNEIAGQQSALQGGQVGGQLAGQGANSLGFLLDPSILSPDSNPYLRASGNAVADTVTDNLNRNVLPGIRSGASMAGPYSGGASKEGIQTGLAVGESNDVLSKALTGMYSNAYQSGLGTMLQANSQVPMMQAAQLFPGMVQSGVGAQQRGMEQATLDANNQRDILQQMMPLLQAQQLYGMISGMPGGSTTSTATGALPPGAGGFQRALGGAGTGAAIGSMIPGLGTGIGALLGGAGSYFFGG
jgi:hypothetical protein